MWGIDPWVLGVALAVFSAVFTNLGINIQKLAHTLNKRDQIIAAQFDHADLSSPLSPSLDESYETLSRSYHHSSNKKRLYKTPSAAAQSSAASFTAAGHTFLKNISSRISKIISKSDHAVDEAQSSDTEGEDNQSIDSMDIRSQYDDDELVSSPYQSHPIWQLGLGVMIFGSLADFAALALAPQSIVAPLGSLTLVFNIFFARWMHHERITPLGIMATAFIVLGSVVTVSFASHKDESFLPEHLFDLYFTQRFIIYASIVIFLVSFFWRVAASWSAEADRNSTIEEESWKFHYFKLLVSGLSGMIGAHSILFAKFTAELIADDVLVLFSHLMGYLTLVGLGVTIWAQIKWLNEGIKRFDSIYVLPVAKAFWVFFSVVSGLITFAEYRELTVMEALMFCVGIGFVITGVCIFSQAKTSEPVSTLEGTVDLEVLLRQ
eukprot:TRINITY_DN1032_c0_g1_i2.p1 TRINITY_DN1032_c0_g1~~TRINITY_DN1032_c0_g1_i2.p1  ORF type:complete len:435 (-),score=106.79 TRINITY_DN1032_c0_g1_i2:332-1636(-)